MHDRNTSHFNDSKSCYNTRLAEVLMYQTEGISKTGWNQKFKH